MKIRKIRSGFTVEEYLLLARRFVMSGEAKAEHIANVIHWKRPYNPAQSRLWFGMENLPDELRNKDFYEHLVFVNNNDRLACYYLLSVDFKAIGLRKINSKKTDKLIGGYADFFRDNLDYIRNYFDPIMGNLDNATDVYTRLVGSFRISPFSPYENPDSFAGELGVDIDDMKTMPNDEEPDGLAEYVDFINWDAVEKTVA